MSTDKFSNTIDKIQSGLVWFVIAIITVCISVLFLFDVLAGTGTMLYLTGNKEWQSVVISLATTGLLFALMFIGYMLTTESKSKFIMSVGKGIMVISFLIYVEDVIFDALLADILRYGTILTSVDTLQWMFRVTIGGISTVGDALAIAMIVGMPVLKTIIREAVAPNPQPQPAKSVGEVISKLPKAVAETRPHPYYHPKPAQNNAQRPAPRPTPVPPKPHPAYVSLSRQIEDMEDDREVPVV